ncbi:MAG: translation initiation factor IF-3, partial [Desulfovibrio sp.]|nr:translation initiation factor IF-3 [Desulfovibrio sp.]
MASPNLRPRRAEAQDSVRRNDQIRVREVRLIGADGEQLGIVERNQALLMAQEAGC